MADGALRNATYEDLLAVPDHLVGEIIAGTLITSPRPAARHSNATSGLGVLVGGPFRYGVGGPGGWVILDEPEVHRGADVLVPDLAGWKRERMPEIPDVAHFTLAPDWVCEVLSPSTASVDRADKMPIYGREGVEHVWLLDPILRTLEVYRRASPHWVLVNTWSGDVKVRPEPFDAVELDLALLWQR